MPRTCSPGRITTWPHDNRHWNRAERALAPGEATNCALVTLRTGAAMGSGPAARLDAVALPHSAVQCCKSPTALGP